MTEQQRLEALKCLKRINTPEKTNWMPLIIIEFIVFELMPAPWLAMYALMGIYATIVGVYRQSKQPKE